MLGKTDRPHRVLPGTIHSAAEEIEAAGGRALPLAVDLRDLDWSGGRVVHLTTRLGIGETVVAVPADICVEADAHAGAGALQVAGQESDGPDADLSVAGGSEATPRLVLDGRVNMGVLRVINDDTVDIAEHGPSWDWGNAADLRAANARACAA